MIGKGGSHTTINFAPYPRISLPLDSFADMLSLDRPNCERHTISLGEKTAKADIQESRIP
jgi:hypothetical protein